MTDYDSPDALRRQIEAELPRLATIEYIPSKTYELRFADVLCIDDLKLLEVAMAAYDGPRPRVTVDEILKPNAVHVIFADSEASDYAGLAWLHDMFRPYVTHTATMELMRADDGRLGAQLVLLNDFSEQRLLEIMFLLKSTSVVAWVERLTSGRSLDIWFVPGITLEQIRYMLLNSSAVSRQLCVTILNRIGLAEDAP